VKKVKKELWIRPDQNANPDPGIKKNVNPDPKPCLKPYMRIRTPGFSRMNNCKKKLLCVYYRTFMEGFQVLGKPAAHQKERQNILNRNLVGFLLQFGFTKSGSGSRRVKIMRILNPEK